MQWYLCQILAKERWDVPLKNWISLVESINSSPWSKLQEHPIFSSSALHRVTSKQASGWHFWSVGVAYPSLAITAHLWHICKSAHCDTSAHYTLHICDTSANLSCNTSFCIKVAQNRVADKQITDSGGFLAQTWKTIGQIRSAFCRRHQVL